MHGIFIMGLFQPSTLPHYLSRSLALSFSQPFLLFRTPCVAFGRLYVAANTVAKIDQAREKNKATWYAFECIQFVHTLHDTSMRSFNWLQTIDAFRFEKHWLEVNIHSLVRLLAHCSCIQRSHSATAWSSHLEITLWLTLPIHEMWKKKVLYVRTHWKPKIHVSRIACIHSPCSLIQFDFSC